MRPHVNGNYRGKKGFKQIQCNDEMKGTYLAVCDCNNELMNKIKSYACMAYIVIAYTAKLSSNVICYAHFIPSILHLNAYQHHCSWFTRAHSFSSWDAKSDGTLDDAEQYIIQTLDAMGFVTN